MNPKRIDRRNEIVSSLEEYFQLKFPKSYREFLLIKGEEKINGLPIYGLPFKLPESSNAWELSIFFEKLPLIQATEILRFHRPDLPKSLVAIRLLDVRALCLDLQNGTEEDCPLVEVNLKEKDKPPNQVHPSFKKYLEEGEKTQKRIQEALEQLRKCREDTERKRKKKFEHLKSEFHPRAEDWRPIRSCVHDEVVGLCALKYDPLADALLVAGFVATDHPNYEEGHGIRSLALAILSDAYKSGSSMKIIFGKAIFDKNGVYRGFQPTRVPEELVKLAEEYGISFSNSYQGVILPSESTGLYTQLLNIPPNVKQKIFELQRTGLTLQAFCYIIGSNIWSREEAIWLVLNHPCPEGTLLGKDFPEDRIFYLESLSYGRAALAVSRLKQKILVDLEENFPQEKDKIYCEAEIKGKFWILKASHKFNLPWVADNLKIQIRAEQPILVLPRPYPRETVRMTSPKTFEDYFNLLKEEKLPDSIKILLASDEMKDCSELMEISEKFKKENIHLVLPAFNCKDLDEEVNKRMAKARLIRK